MKIKNNLAVFIINLKKDIKKKQHIQKLCKKYHLHPEFIEAVNGQELSDEEIKTFYKKALVKTVFGRELSHGEIGCALSHKKIYNKIINENIEIALILEDDIDFNKKLLDSLNLINQLPNTWQLILLGHHAPLSRDINTEYSLWYKKRIAPFFILRRPCKLSVGTYGYLINIDGAKSLVKHLKSINKPIDHYTGNDQYSNLFVVEKPVIYINSTLSKLSNITIGRERLCSSSQIKKNKFWKILVTISKKIKLHRVLNTLLERLIIWYKKIKIIRRYK